MNSLPDTSKRRSSVNHAEAVDTMPPWDKSIHRLCKALENQTAGNRVPLKIQGWIFRKTVPLKPVRITPQETELSRIRPN